MNNANMQRRAVIFVRARDIGPGGQRDRHIEDGMIAAQRQQCLSVADRLNVEVVREYAERGGAGKLDNRPVLQLMLDELRALRDAEYVIVTSRDRLARTTDDWARLDLELEAAGATLLIAADGYHEVGCGNLSDRITEGLIDV